MSLQTILKLQNKFNPKTRVRKFKSRVLKSHVVKFSNRGRGSNLESGLKRYVLRADKSCIVGFKALIGMEKSLMYAKGCFAPAYRDYPRTFVTAKSSKSRMGKGKGKITGRIQKVIKNQVMFEVDMRMTERASYFLRAMRSSLPVTTSLVEPDASSLSAIDHYYRWRKNKNTWFLAASGKKAKRQKFIQSRQKKTVKHDIHSRRKRARKKMFFPHRTHSPTVYLNIMHNYTFPYKARRLSKWPKLCEGPLRFDQIKYYHTWSRRDKDFYKAARAEGRLTRMGTLLYRGYRVIGTRKHINPGAGTTLLGTNPTLLRKCSGDWRNNRTHFKKNKPFYKKTCSLHLYKNLPVLHYIGKALFNSSRYLC